MIPVPDMNVLDCAFGNIKHLPKWETIPDKYKNLNGLTCWNKFVSDWFFGGLKKEDIDALKPKEGIDKTKALSAIKSILCSFEPKQEHKEAGTAYLMSEWFEEKQAVV